jgi:hypothetical protein
MPAKPKTTKPLHQQLLEGFEVKANGKTVAEVCVGKQNVRLNLRAAVKASKGLMLGGKSKSWPGGGTVITDANLAAARALLEVASGPAGTTAGDTAAASSAVMEGRRGGAARRAAGSAVELIAA